MKAHTYGTIGNPTLMLMPGLGVSYEMFLPLIKMLEDRFFIVALEVDGFILGEYTRFTSINDQAGQAIAYVKENLNGRLDCAYGLSMGGKILSRILEREEIEIGHAIIAKMADRSAASLSVSQCMDMLPLDRILEVYIPFPLF